MRELGSLRVFAEAKRFWPADLAQYDLRRAAALLPGLTFPVTAVCSFEPGLARLWACTPAFVMPAPDLVDL